MRQTRLRFVAHSACCHALLWVVTAFMLLTAKGVSCRAATLPPDSLSRWSGAIGASAGSVLAMDEYVKRWLQDSRCFSIAAELTHTALPQDSDNFAADYGYPSIGLGVRYAFNHGVTMRRYADPAWGKLQPVDFDSRLGNTFSLYLTFRRPLFRSRHFEAGYAIDGGVGYSRSKYNLATAPDNELIGSHVLIYFGTSAWATWFFSRAWGLRASIDFYHHSNGALNRPNKGANTLGPSLALVYAPTHRLIAESPSATTTKKFNKHFYLNFTLGIGGKTLLEDWQQTQYDTDSSEPRYRTNRFHFYMAYALSADLMYRYTRRWASGIGIDGFYGTYADHVKMLDEAAGHTVRHSPWSVGIAAKHQAYFHRLSVAMSVGVYLFRHMGYQANIIETPYYERVGLHYTFPALGGLDVGINVKAHKTKADLTEIAIAVPLKL